MSADPYYHDDLVTLYRGDCLEVMRGLQGASVDLVFTSPPYNLGTTAPGTGGLKRGGAWKSALLKDGYADHGDAMPFPEYVAWQHDVLRECWRLIKPTGAIYYQHKPRVQAGILQTPLALIPQELPVRQVVIWDRGGGGINFAPTHYLPTHEWVVIIAGPGFKLRDKGASGIGDVWRVSQASNNDHPAPFPLSLPARAIDSTGARVVLDPFCGSGTTLRAATDAGVRGIGIEISEAYCEMAVTRLRQGALNFGDTA